MKLSVRKALLSDNEIIISFQQKMAKETEDLNLDLNKLKKGVLAVLNDAAKGTYYMATQDDKIVGMLMTTYEWSDWRNAQLLWIQSVYVLPEFRKQGVFKIMYNYLKNKVESSPKWTGLRLYVETENLKAQKVYQAMGMDGSHYYLYEWLK